MIEDSASQYHTALSQDTITDELKARYRRRIEELITIKENMRLNCLNTIHALVLALEERDPYTRNHAERVTNYALQVGYALSLPSPDIELLRYSSEVHDIGKISIPDHILNKPARLSVAERIIIQIHPVTGEQMLQPLEFLKPALPIVRHHHERYDGRGYPDKIGGEMIPLFSRIIACADSFDAMTSERPYRLDRMTPQEAFIEIKNNSGSQFDPKIANLFIERISSYLSSPK